MYQILSFNPGARAQIRRTICTCIVGFAIIQILKPHTTMYINISRRVVTVNKQTDIHAHRREEIANPAHHISREVHEGSYRVT